MIKNLIKLTLNNKCLNNSFIRILMKNLNRVNFSTNQSVRDQYNKKFLVRVTFEHSSDAYYETYPFRQQFRKQIKQLQDSNKVYLFGGDLFPMQGSIFIVNCDQLSVVQDFFNKNNIYAHNKLIKSVDIEEVQQISDEKMKKLSYFYQYK